MQEKNKFNQTNNPWVCRFIDDDSNNLIFSNSTTQNQDIYSDFV